MAVVVAFVSQKGGVGKSTLARALAAVASHADARVLLADLDPQQHTVMHWEKRRRQNKDLPPLAVRAFRTGDEAIDAASGYELLVLDTPGSVSRATFDIARRSHLVVQPTGPTLDDLDPAVLLFHELAKAGIPRDRLLFAVCRTLTKEEEREARTYLHDTGYAVLAASIPERAVYRGAQNAGYGLTETKEGELNARADALLSELLTKVAEAIARDKRDATKRRSAKGDAA